jgi:hypothetical protein
MYMSGATRSRLNREGAAGSLGISLTHSFTLSLSLSLSLFASVPFQRCSVLRKFMHPPLSVSVLDERPLLVRTFVGVLYV